MKMEEKIISRLILGTMGLLFVPVSNAYAADTIYAGFTVYNDFFHSSSVAPQVDDFNSYEDGEAITELFEGLIQVQGASIFWGNWDLLGSGGSFMGGALISEPRHVGSSIFMYFDTPVFGVGANVFDDFYTLDRFCAIAFTTTGTRLDFCEDTAQMGDTGFLGLTSDDGIVEISYHPSPPTPGSNMELERLTIIPFEEADEDGDGVADNVDNCPSDVNPEQENNDGDILGDVCDPDDDNDTVADIDDNCPLVANTLQEDLDFDGLGDVCDATFNTNSVAQHVEDVAVLSVQDVTIANPPGGNGMIAKLTGNGGVTQKVANAVNAYEAQAIDVATYIAGLQDALSKLDAFENQLNAKVDNGSIIEPEASNIQGDIAELRMTINSLISEAGGV